VLVEAYVNHEPVDAIMTEADAKAQLDLRTDQLRYAEEIESAIRFEIADIENGLKEHENRCLSAVGTVVGRTPQFLSLISHIYAAYAELRNCRLVIDEIEPLVHIDRDLISLADNHQPCDRSRAAAMTTKRSCPPIGPTRSAAADRWRRSVAGRQLQDRSRRW